MFANCCGPTSFARRAHLWTNATSSLKLPPMTESDSNQTADVHLFTDGACSGNPGPGGWAFVLRHLKTGKEMELAGCQEDATNNSMELTAVIRGLAALKRPCRVDLFTDSVYVGKGMSEWMAGWKRNGWRRRERGQFKPVKNVELWQQLDQLLERHRVRYFRVAGHSGHPENERCDELAVAAYQRLL